MEEITFDKAIDLLEITDISKVKVEDIPRLKRKANARWHPDRVSHLNDPLITKEYTENFQQIEFACELIVEYLTGQFHAGNQFSTEQQYDFEPEEEFTRSNAEYFQQSIKNVWSSVKQTKYRWSSKEFIISDGRKVKELIDLDFKEEVAVNAIISFYYGIILLGLTAGIAGIFNPVAGAIVGIVFLIQATSCVLGFLPLSRFWLPRIVSDTMVLFINFGLGIYNSAYRASERSESIWLRLLVQIPLLFAKLIKYVILFPLYEFTKLFLGDKVIGVVKQRENYFADVAEWYIDELLEKPVNNMTDEEISHLSYLYNTFNEFKTDNSQKQEPYQSSNARQSDAENNNKQEESQTTSSNWSFNESKMDNEKSTQNRKQESFCSSCGLVLSSEMKFCPSCGAPTNYSNTRTAEQPLNEKKNPIQDYSEARKAHSNLNDDIITNNKKRVNKKILAMYLIILILLSGGYFAFNYIKPKIAIIENSNDPTIVLHTLETLDTTKTSPTPSTPSKTALFFDALHKADTAFYNHRDSLAKDLYETAILYEPNDAYALKQLSIVTTRLEKTLYALPQVKSIESKLKPMKTIIPSKLMISFIERNSITWSDLGKGWEYAVTITEKDAGNAEVYSSNLETCRIELPITNLFDNRLYIIKIKSVMDTIQGPINSKSFSLINNGSKLDPTCR